MRVEPSRSVSRKVTVPEGGCPTMPPTRRGLQQERKSNRGAASAVQSCQHDVADELGQAGLDVVVVAGETLVGHVHLDEIAMHVATEVVEPLDRCAMPRDQFVGFR